MLKEVLTFNKNVLFQVLYERSGNGIQENPVPSWIRPSLCSTVREHKRGMHEGRVTHVIHCTT